MDFVHVYREGVVDLFAFYDLAALVLLFCGRFDSYHGGLSDDIEADFDGDFLFIHARLQDNDFEGALFDIVFDNVLISGSKDAKQFLVACFDLLVGRI